MDFLPSFEQHEKIEQPEHGAFFFEKMLVVMILNDWMLCPFLFRDKLALPLYYEDQKPKLF